MTRHQRQGLRAIVIEVNHRGFRQRHQFIMQGRQGITPARPQLAEWLRVPQGPESQQRLIKLPLAFDQVQCRPARRSRRR